ncbi:MAG: hypothetical protein DRI46_12750 [Chloroflexi bacterium]|nr:MAG: hypothetical protein DRI46_12750 [Chloroflexota bacterium]
MQSLKNKGKETGLDLRPVLDFESVALWNMFCSIGSEILLSLDVYYSRIGFPLDWEFNEVLSLVISLESYRQKLAGANSG